VSEADTRLWKVARDLHTATCRALAKLKPALEPLLPSLATAVATHLGREELLFGVRFRWKCEATLDHTSFATSASSVDMFLTLTASHDKAHPSFVVSGRTCQLRCQSQGQSVPIELANWSLAKIWRGLEAGVAAFISEHTGCVPSVSTCESHSASFELDGARINVLPAVQSNPEAPHFVFLRTVALDGANCSRRFLRLAANTLEILPHNARCMVCALKHAAQLHFHIDIPPGFWENIVHRVFSSHAWLSPEVTVVAFVEAWRACWELVFDNTHDLEEQPGDQIPLSDCVRAQHQARSHDATDILSLLERCASSLLSSPTPSTSDDGHWQYILLEHRAYEWIRTHIRLLNPYCLPWRKFDLPQLVDSILSEWVIVCTSHEPPADKLSSLLRINRKMVVILLFPGSSTCVGSETPVCAESILVSFDQSVPPAFVRYWMLLFLSPTISAPSPLEKVEMANWQLGLLLPDSDPIKALTKYPSYRPFIERPLVFAKNRWRKQSLKVLWLPLCKSLTRINELHRNHELVHKYNIEMAVPEGDLRRLVSSNSVDLLAEKLFTGLNTCWLYCQSLGGLVSRIGTFEVRDVSTVDLLVDETRNTIIHNPGTSPQSICFNDPLLSEELCEHFLANQAAVAAELSSNPALATSDGSRQLDGSCSISLYSKQALGSPSLQECRQQSVLETSKLFGIQVDQSSAKYQHSASFWMSFHVDLEGVLIANSKPAGWIACLQSLGFSKVRTSVLGTVCEYSIDDLRFKIPCFPPSWTLPAHQDDDPRVRPSRLADRTGAVLH